jgi:hypothetical protein
MVLYECHTLHKTGAHEMKFNTPGEAPTRSESQHKTVGAQLAHGATELHVQGMPDNSTGLHDTLAYG